MTPKRLGKIKQRLYALKKSPRGLKPAIFVSLAEQLGRKLSPRGNHPNYVRFDEPVLAPPLSIPAHRELKTGTACCIIDQLLSDVDEWELFFHGRAE